MDGIKPHRGTRNGHIRMYFSPFERNQLLPFMMYNWNMIDNQSSECFIVQVKVGCT